MSDKTKQLTIAQSEFMKHESEYSRLQALADIVLTDMEYHARQMDTWNQYIGSLTAPAVVVAPPAPVRHLYLVPTIEA